MAQNFNRENLTDGIGKIVQVVNYQTGAVATGTTTIPFDNTKPQIAEGDQYMSLAITPINATDILQIEVVAYASQANNATRIIAALFDGSDNALATAMLFQYTTGGNGPDGPLVINFRKVANTIDPITFTVRIGSDGAGTVTFNGASGSGLFDGTFISSITITEIAV